MPRLMADDPTNFARFRSRPATPTMPKAASWCPWSVRAYWGTRVLCNASVEDKVPRWLVAKAKAG